MANPTSEYGYLGDAHFLNIQPKDILKNDMVVARASLQHPAAGLSQADYPEMQGAHQSFVEKIAFVTANNWNMDRVAKNHARVSQSTDPEQPSSRHDQNLDI